MAARSTFSIIERNPDGTIYQTILDSRTNTKFREDGYSAARGTFAALRSSYELHDGRVLVLVLNGGDAMQEPMPLKRKRGAGASKATKKAASVPEPDRESVPPSGVGTQLALLSQAQPPALKISGGGLGRVPLVSEVVPAPPTPVRPWWDEPDSGSGDGLEAEALAPVSTTAHDSSSSSDAAILSFSTDQLLFRLSVGSPATSILGLKSISTENFAFAVQASNTPSYRVDPSFGVIRAGAQTTLVLSLDDTHKQATITKAGNCPLVCSDQFRVLSIVIPDDVAELIESKPPRERRDDILPLLTGEESPPKVKYLSVALVVDLATPLPAATIPGLAPIFRDSTIAADSSSKDDDDNNVSHIDYTDIWNLPNFTAVERLGLDEVRKMCDDLGLQVVIGAKGKLTREMAKTLFAHMQTHTMPVYEAPPLAPREERVAQQTAEVVAKMSKVVVVNNSTLPGALNAGGKSTGPEERLKIVLGFAKKCEEVRLEAIGLEKTPGSDDEDPDTPRLVFNATENAGPWLVTAAVGQLAGTNRSALNNVVESKIKNGEPLFSEPLPPQYEGALAAHAGVAPRGARGAFTEGHRSAADVKALATAREAGRIVVWDASNYITVASHIKDLVARSRNLTIATTPKEDSFAAFFMQQLFLGSRRVRVPGPDYFRVEFASRTEVEDKLRKMEVELAGDGRSHTLLDVDTIFERYHVIKRTDKSKTARTKQRLTHISLCLIPFEIYAKSDASLLLADLRYADNMKHEEKGWQTLSETVRGYVVTNLFGGTEPSKMDGVHQDNDARLERCMVAMLNVMFLFEDRNTRFKRKRTSHRLSLVHLGDKLPRHETDYGGTHHTYNWTLPYWPQGTADDPELPHTFMPEQA